LGAQFRIYKAQVDGELQFLQGLPTLEDAKARVRELGKHWPGDYVIENDETGERAFIDISDET
jgi:hypothetical protein